MKIHFECECGKHLVAPESMVGRRAKCPQCGKSVEVPQSKKSSKNAAASADNHDFLANLMGQSLPASDSMQNAESVDSRPDHLSKQISTISNYGVAQPPIAERPRVASPPTRGVHTSWFDLANKKILAGGIAIALISTFAVVFAVSSWFRVSPPAAGNGPPIAPPKPPPSDGLPEIIKKVQPSIVKITTNEALGSGFVVDDGLVVTNRHVMEGARTAKVHFKDGRTHEVEGIVFDGGKLDLCILKCKDLSRSNSKPLQLASNSLPQGERLFTFGAPKGLEFSVSEGIVSANRWIDDIAYVQTTAPISSGNSGGPLLSQKDGSLVGINTWNIEDGQNLNFAIAVSHLRDSLTKLKSQPAPLNLTAGDSGKRAEWPKYSAELDGPNEVLIRNPNDFSVDVGLRSGGRGKDFTVPANVSRPAYVPDGRYDIYFRFSSDPDVLYQSDSFTLSNNGFDIKIGKVVGGNLNTRKVK